MSGDSGLNLRPLIDQSAVKITEFDEHVVVARVAVEQFENHAQGLDPSPTNPGKIADRILARLISSRCGLDPTRVDVSRAPSGRPVSKAAPGLFLSMSYTSGIVYVALSTMHPVGVDVERPPAPRNWRRIVQRHMPREREAIAALPDDEQMPAFIRCWVFKEAISKCLELGLALPFASFQVPASGTRIALPVSVAIAGWPNSSFKLVELPNTDETIAALAVMEPAGG